ncbi:hypothetical protein ABZW30_23130 [Kitasatospora sp. NPDC004669]|uniref:hypothetical protein n=1 Tax=Kitasatospora sp. NPDC004669 TaxID=3154555 RepID=UPI0033B1EE06
MNPHNRLTHPGAHLVYDRLGIDDPFTLLGPRYQHDNPHAPLARLVGNAACELDDLNQELTDQARTVMARLEPIARGESAALRDVDAIVQSAALQVGLLTARKDAAHKHLTDALDAYERADGVGGRGPAAVQDRQQDNAHTRPSGRQDLSAIAAWDDGQGFARTALQEVEHGDLWLRTNGHGDECVIRGSGLGAPIEAETVRRLMAAGLVVDTGTSPSRAGHMLSLTPAGAAANAAARAERLRQVAALYCGITPTMAGPAQAAPSAAAARPSLSSRTR